MQTPTRIDTGKRESASSRVWAVWGCLGLGFGTCEQGRFGPGSEFALSAFEVGRG